MTTAVTRIDLASALLDPAITFGTADERLRKGGPAKEVKVGILCRWADEASQPAVARKAG